MVKNKEKEKGEKTQLILFGTDLALCKEMPYPILPPCFLVNTADVIHLTPLPTHFSILIIESIYELQNVFIFFLIFFYMLLKFVSTNFSKIIFEYYLRCGDQKKF